MLSKNLTWMKTRVIDLLKDRLNYINQMKLTNEESQIHYIESCLIHNEIYIRNYIDPLLCQSIFDVYNSPIVTLKQELNIVLMLNKLSM